MVEIALNVLCSPIIYDLILMLGWQKSEMQFLCVIYREVKDFKNKRFEVSIRN